MKSYLFSFTKKRQYILLVGDICTVFLCALLSYLLKVYFSMGDLNMAVVIAKINPWLSIVIMIHILMLYLFDQYNLGRLVIRFRNSAMLVISVWLSGLVISGFFFFLPKYVFGRQVLIIHLLLTSIFLVLWRSLIVSAFARRSKEKRLAVVGDGQIVSSFIEDLTHIQNSGFVISNVCLLGPPHSCVLPDFMVKHENIFTLLKNNDFDALAFDSAHGSFSDADIRNMLQLRFQGKIVFDLSRLYENITGKIPLTYIDGRWLLGRDGLQGQLNKPYLVAKRLIDLVLASLLLVLTAPLFLSIIVLIKMDSRGRIFYVQERLGVQRRSFKCVKFRSMVQDAEGPSGPRWASANDPRVTRVGRFLRKTRLDELPQLWNILKGDLSFVGPRPIRDYFADRFSRTVPFYELRHTVKPGLTGWAQVHGCHAVPYGVEALQYELFYIQNMSILLDLYILFKTMRTLFHRSDKKESTSEAALNG